MPLADNSVTKEMFCALVLQHQAAMYRTARSILKSDEDAQDAVQEAVCAAFRHRETLKQCDYVKAWLLRVVANKCYDMLRKRTNTVELSQVQEVLAAPEKDSLQSMDLWQAVLRLPDDLRTVVTLYYYEDLPIRQISQILKVSEGTVRSRLFRGREKLKMLLKETV